jgi:hypothetical protein
MAKNSEDRFTTFEKVFTIIGWPTVIMHRIINGSDADLYPNKAQERPKWILIGIFCWGLVSLIDKFISTFLRFY